MKVLIAEDEPISNLWLKNTLTRWGYEAISTRDGYEAWEVLNESDFPRVVILDWEMPKMKGIEVCEKIKKDPRLSSIYIILITGRDLTEDMEAGFKAGADDYLKKPFDNRKLKTKLDTARKKLGF
ncbi:TPA: response regulator [Methanosarcina acetivorans]|uniref:Response regulator receiver n=2 Tax=Methanosarcina acetivorans TaxID=2214 RepID=Q8TPA2_METAC|nr:response regulator [Methanosarcina acetivorans]AAM05415.1 response regulator receiver [Methanosarcina acetivorans C2A]HIH95786.1 response regulator [Methanosarcina acetivorans]